MDYGYSCNHWYLGIIQNNTILNMVRYSYNRCPHKSKQQLVNWYVKYFKSSRSEATSKHKKQLYKIWYSVKSTKY